MTSPRQRNLGPVLALAGGGIALAAVVAGFLVIGGPGDERNKRLDDMTESRIDTVLSVVNCAFKATGMAPATLAEAASTPGFRISELAYGPCRALALPSFDESVATTSPDQPGEISYNVTADDSIRICAFFRAARKPGEQNCMSSFSDVYPVLDAPRPAGAHCYDITLNNTVDTEIYRMGGHRASCAFNLMH